ncbi:MAG: Regulator of sigma-W protease RasP [Parcubacteria group bacterium ADurb.Bin316]|nr:MAG: Regulator of sigma-W protease RasP [Parcubacteria group bacterium ADurb.Bin316]HOZ56236.1 RIP metalloprotease RseP [bacterium]
MFLTIVVFIAVLSLLVFVHELGHFWVAKRFGLIPEEFGFGYPPRAVGYYKNKEGKWQKVFGNKPVNDASDTVYSINWVPIGGFVKLGEDDVAEAGANHFNNKPIWQRAAILFAGVFMNFLLAAFLFAVGYMIGLPQAISDLNPSAEISNKRIQIMEVMSGSPAEQAEFKAGDAILSINNEAMISLDQMEKYVDERKGQKLNYKIERAGVEIEKEATPEVRQETGKGGIGVAIIESGIVRYPFFVAIWEGFKTAVEMTLAILFAFYVLLKGIFTGTGVSADLAGPVGIAVLTGQVAKMGFVYILQFTAILSINLAIINALPFPALDGGRLLFLLIESIKGSPVKKELEGTIHYVGFILLMILVVFVTYRDVAKYGGKFFSSLLSLFN